MKIRYSVSKDSLTLLSSINLDCSYDSIRRLSVSISTLYCSLLYSRMLTYCTTVMYSSLKYITWQQLRLLAVKFFQSLLKVTYLVLVTITVKDFIVHFFEFVSIVCHTIYFNLAFSSVNRSISIAINKQYTSRCLWSGRTESIRCVGVLLCIYYVLWSSDVSNNCLSSSYGSTEILIFRSCPHLGFWKQSWCWWWFLKVAHCFNFICLIQ
jgi:hypothetical protein